ncbi:MAG: putative Universal stress protein UspA [Armatimonadetes bacterium]|nr:putative Universal stress protein UspA [Armatimonadota bacterium]
MRILYATDGSEGATAAGRLLATLPLPPGATSTVLHVSPDDRHDQTELALEVAATALTTSETAMVRCTRRGHAAAEILSAAEELSTDLIVLGSHGRSALARFLLGSVAERVARHAPCPVLLVRGSGEGLRQVVLGVDGSAGSTHAVDYLRRFPLPPGCEVRVVAVLANLHQIMHEHLILTPPLTETSIPFDQWQREQAAGRLAEATDALRETGKQVVTEIRSGDAAPGLIATAADEGADLIVLGSHGAGALERVLLGSVSQHVLSHAPCSVLIVRGAAE